MKRKTTKNQTKYVFGHVIEVHATPEQKKLIRLNHQGKVDAYNLAIIANDTFYHAHKWGFIPERINIYKLNRMMTAARKEGEPLKKKKRESEEEFADRLLREGKEDNKPKYPYTYTSKLHSLTIHKTVDNYWDALKKFFKECKKAKKLGIKMEGGYPQNKIHKNHWDMSICVAYGSQANKLKIIEGGWAIRLPTKAGGYYRFKEKVRFAGIIKTAHIKIIANKVYLSLNIGTDNPPRDIPPGDKSFAIDLGSKKSTVYNGKHYFEIGAEIEKESAEFREWKAKEQKKLSRMRGTWDNKKKRRQRQSRRHYTKRMSIRRTEAKSNRRLRDMRNNLVFSMIKNTALASDGGFIAIQNDNLKSQHKKKKGKPGSKARLIQTSKTASRMGWGYIRQELKTKAPIYGRQVILIHQLELTTGICPYRSCRHIHSKKAKSLRTTNKNGGKIICAGCEREYCRDEAAAFNIYQMAKGNYPTKHKITKITPETKD